MSFIHFTPHFTKKNTHFGKAIAPKLPLTEGDGHTHPHTDLIVTKPNFSFSKSVGKCENVPLQSAYGISEQSKNHGNSLDRCKKNRRKLHSEKLMTDESFGVSVQR